MLSANLGNKRFLPWGERRCKYTIVFCHVSMSWRNRRQGEVKKIVNRARMIKETRLLDRMREYRSCKRGSMGRVAAKLQF